MPGSGGTGTATWSCSWAWGTSGEPAVIVIRQSWVWRDQRSSIGTVRDELSSYLGAGGGRLPMGYRPEVRLEGVGEEPEDPEYLG